METTFIVLFIVGCSLAAFFISLTYGDKESIVFRIFLSIASPSLFFATIYAGLHEQSLLIIISIIIATILGVITGYFIRKNRKKVISFY